MRHILANYMRRRVLAQTASSQYFIAIAVVVGVAIVLSVVLIHFANPKNSFDLTRVSPGEILIAATNTFSRMLAAYVVSLIVAIPLALGIASTPLAQRIFLPIADVLQSVPVLAFFPIIVAFFAAYRAFELAAVFVIFVQMVWNIVFPVIGGLQTIPDDVRSAAIVFNVRGVRKFWYITLPATLPFVITGSLLAWAQGWTIVIVAEVLHTYLPHGTPSQDLLGLGSLLVDSNAEGHTAVFAATLGVMIVLVALINLLIWQPLLRFSQRFRFD
ncbi:MAG: ABC transporter permease subunit [Candidatus Eremiobacteraeota bacterium]|nr:ABC transporter permease subunit [Candidatus Eremiobacteraeota bacterium]